MITINQIKKIYSIIKIMERNGGFATPEEIDTELEVSDRSRRTLINIMREYGCKIPYKGSDKIYSCNNFTKLYSNIAMRLLKNIPIEIYERMEILNAQKEYV